MAFCVAEVEQGEGWAALACVSKRVGGALTRRLEMVLALDLDLRWREMMVLDLSPQ